ncbi:MAG: FAD-dependent monooxygenase, partial [Gramella sp.]|nr:FAD-dependent monooxygenase [Christiangramia sp.]
MKDTRVIIIGGGLAGLTAAIDLCKRGIEVILFEKENYPHHKVCGEYLSNEILPYLRSLDIDLNSLHPVQINKLLYSSNSGDMINCGLKLGGIGISRFALDHHLYNIALSKGCKIVNTAVNKVLFRDNSFKVFTKENQEYKANFVLGAFGKRSNIDKALDRKFFGNQSSWLAVKAHYRNDNYPEDLVSLHNFQGGYCGLSRTELDT